MSVDHVIAAEIGTELQAYIALKPTALLCDLSGAKYVSSSALRAILNAGKNAKTAGIRFGVFGLSKFADHIFAMTGFTKIIAIYDTEEAALLAMRRP